MENELYKPNMPFRYLVSCGVSMKSLMPGWGHKWWRAFEKILESLAYKLRMITYIFLVKAPQK